MPLGIWSVADGPGGTVWLVERVTEANEMPLVSLFRSNRDLLIILDNSSPAPPDAWGKRGIYLDFYLDRDAQGRIVGWNARRLAVLMPAAQSTRDRDMYFHYTCVGVCVVEFLREKFERANIQLRAGLRMNVGGVEPADFRRWYNQRPPSSRRGMPEEMKPHVAQRVYRGLKESPLDSEFKHLYNALVHEDRETIRAGITVSDVIARFHQILEGSVANACDEKRRTAVARYGAEALFGFGMHIASHI